MDEGRTPIKVFDPTLGNWISVKSLRVLRLCPVDVFFTPQSSGLHASTLKALSRNGYLNEDKHRDGLTTEYYLNNHGHRIRQMHIHDFMLKRFASF